MATRFPPPSPPFIKARHFGGSQTPKAIVIHGTVSSDNPGTARNIANWWAGPTSPVTSAQYVVDPREVIQCVGDHTVAYHCGFNTGSIAIELCDEQAGPASRWRDEDSQAIVRRAARLAAKLCLAYNIEPIRPTIAALKRKGPHGIYGHNDSRLAFGHTSHTDPRDFGWDEFLRRVRGEMAKIKAAAEAKVADIVRLNLMHASMQVQDPDTQKIRDARAVFERAERRDAAWITGTEAGAGSSALREALRNWANQTGYRFWMDPSQDSWIAVSRKLITGDFVTHYEKVIDGKKGLYTDKGVLSVGFDTEKLGRINVIACHLQTRGRPDSKDPAYRVRLAQNAMLNRAIGAYAAEVGAGKSLVFYGGDQNIPDNLSDTFMGQPFTSAWDELGKWRNTGHGNIDVIASYDRDGRVEASYIRAINDERYPLFSDHFLVEAGFNVRALG